MLKSIQLIAFVDVLGFEFLAMIMITDSCILCNNFVLHVELASLIACRCTSRSKFVIASGDS